MNDYLDAVIARQLERELAEANAEAVIKAALAESKRLKEIERNFIPTP